MVSNGYSVVPVQKAFTALRIIQVILSIIILGLAAYVVSLTNSYGYSSYVFEPGALAIFTTVATWIFVAYWFVANSTAGTKLYNYWAILAVEFFVWVFWLTTFALYASYVSSTLAAYGGGPSSSDNEVCYSGYCVNVSYKRGLLKRSYSVDTVSATIYAALALSVVDFLLFSVTLILYAVNLFRHRATNASAGPTTHYGGSVSVTPHNKIEMA